MDVVDTHVPYHQQDTQEYCGVAVAQMLLASDALGSKAVEQAALFQPGNDSSLYFALTMRFGSRSKVLQLGTSTPVLWETSPPVLRDILTKNSGSTAFSIPPSSTDANLGCQRIAHTLVRSGIGVPAVVWGAKHWVVVTGVVLDGARVGGPPYAIRGFYINNPQPQTPPDSGTNSPHRHFPHDACGTGNVNGSSNTYVTIGCWLQRYWGSASSDPAYPGFIIVSALSQREIAPVAQAPRRNVAVIPPISAGDAQTAAHDGIVRDQIDSSGPLRDALRGFVPGPVTYGNELGDGGAAQDRSYVLVDLLVNGKLSGTAFVDAKTRAFLGVEAPAARPATLPRIDVQQLAADALARHSAELSDLFAPAAWSTERYSVHPDLVWRPCRQSMSPFYAFVQVNVAGRALFVGMDGRVYRSLDTGVHA